MRGDQPLPLVYLECAESQAGFLAELRRRLAGGTSQVPVVLVNADEAADHGKNRWSRTAPSGELVRQLPLIPLLDELSVRLAADRFGRGRLGRFDHYRLADWLTGQYLQPPHGRDDRADVVRLLRSWVGRDGAPDQAIAAEMADLAPSTSTKLGVRLLAWVGRRIGFRWFRGRVPGLAREIRWFMGRQGYMVPKHSTDFLGFAERLTAGHRDSENEDHLKKLLVHAFLEDLRIAYRRRRLLFLPRRAGFRRTAYVTVLLDQVTTHNGGRELLELVNAVRNETGELDPVLFVAASTEQPPLSAALSTEPVLAGEANAALRIWRDNLPSRRQRMTEDARYLIVTVPPAGPAVREADRAAWEDIDFRPASPPRFARRGLLEVTVAVGLTIALVPAFTSVQERVAAGCSVLTDLSDGDVRLVVADDMPGGAQCVGYSDSDSHIFGTDKRLGLAQEAVFAQNMEAKRLHEDNLARPYLSLVYFAGLTHGGNRPDTDQAIAEELEGLLVRQRQQNRESAPDPLLRIVVANGGAEMKAAPRVVEEMLAPLMRADPSVVGVVGMDRSVAETKVAIQQLGAIGMPTVATTLTATGLDLKSASYFQLVPGNARQAELIATHASQVGATKVSIYHPKAGDLYTTSLVEETKRILTEKGIKVGEVPWEFTVASLPSLCDRQVDLSREMVFYAGREADFGGFLQALTKGCYQRELLPRIVGDDAIDRFMAQQEEREKDHLANVRVSFVSMGSLVVLAGRSCMDGKASPASGGGAPLDTFCAGYSTLDKERTRALGQENDPKKPWPGERIGVAYDAAGLFVEAVSSAGRRTETENGERRPVSAAAVGQELRDLRFKGATGVIELGLSRVGERRNIALLEIADIHDFSSAPRCVQLIGDLYEPNQKTSTNGCPAQ